MNCRKSNLYTSKARRSVAWRVALLRRQHRPQQQGSNNRAANVSHSMEGRVERNKLMYAAKG